MKIKMNLLWMLALAFVLAGATVVGWTSVQPESGALYLSCDEDDDDDDNDEGGGGGDADQMPSDLVVRG